MAKTRARKGKVDSSAATPDDSRLRTLEAEYRGLVPIAEGFAIALKSEISTLLAREQVALGTAVDYRVKSWNSLSEKLKRRNLSVTTVRDMDDFVGVRIMLLFLRDVERVCKLIEQHFEVKEHENVATRLAQDQFGYVSIHYILKLPDKWRSVPSFAPYKGWRAEIQVRTLAQHIWAASSHILQYKHESSVPDDVRRSIYRVSALLETVDLEFERALKQREEYRESISSGSRQVEKDTLNVDLLEELFDSVLPAKNKEPGHESYALLLPELHMLNVRTVGDLKKILQEQRGAILAEDKARVAQERERAKEGRVLMDPDRLKKGVFYLHVGLARNALRHHFGAKYNEVANALREPTATRRMRVRKESTRKR